MKSTTLKISLFIMPLAFGLYSCEKDNLEPFHAKGRIIEITSGCYGEVVLIEVENPKGICEAGTFAFYGEKENKITYKNAIAVPYFAKIGIPNTVSQTIGTWLYFEYRELTEAEKIQSNLFEPDYTMACLGIFGPPSAPRLIVTKVIDFSSAK